MSGSFRKIKWFEPKKIKEILLENLNLKINYEDLKNACNSMSVYIKEEEIKKYLSCCVGLDSGFNQYDGYSLTYYKNYMFILKKKCNELFNIIDSLEMNYQKNKENILCDYNKSVKGIIKKYDISLNPVGKVYGKDVYRIINPLLYNIRKLISLYEESNKFSTYYDKRIDLEELEDNEIDLKDLYPRCELQITDAYVINNNGYIPLTANQKSRFNFCDLINEGIFVNIIDEDKLFKKREVLSKKLK